MEQIDSSPLLGQPTSVCIEATRQQRTTETWTFLVGPTLTRLQFHRAIGTASVASQIVSVQPSPREFTVNIHSVEADWDDENQRVNMRVEIGLISNGAAGDDYPNSLLGRDSGTDVNGRTPAPAARGFSAAHIML